MKAIEIDTLRARRLALLNAGLLKPEWTGMPVSGTRSARKNAHAIIDRFGYLQLDTVSIAGARSHPLVLLAEDDAAMRDFLVELLEAAGFRVRAFGHGAPVIERLRETPTDTPAADLIITDVHMPRSSGFDVLEEVRRLAATQPMPPVILITAFGDAGTVEAALDCGAAVILDKPFDPGLLLVRARELTLHRGES